ncbi:MULTISPECIES: GntR family transcriptional regulator [Enterococcus]|uniref:GntR family transcriptional regulator n=1 Tax=Enterococcus diestrammenae TaxID=1155073 RepID=A0ABV0F2P9_9ENTE|nr:GntR family transcriptional regulator [Enterococcus diestrammenae]KAF1299829.1 GntR family transcriptional regulator [Enterococcus diestrammenae]HIX69399.1 GntR family transcriptional regulator [Candidatus Enterococcus stercoravium]
MTSKKISMPRYQQIAIALAERIVQNRYHEGEKIHARSTLASNFNVSPETARKAINVLVDLDIMEVRHGSGAYVASRAKAENFLTQYHEVRSIQETKGEILASVKRQQQELENFSTLLDSLVNQTKRIQHTAPFIPYQILLTDKALHLNASIGELNIWQQTGATIVALQHDERLLLSPGPYAKFEEGETVFFVGDELSVQRVHRFFYLE